MSIVHHGMVGEVKVNDPEQETPNPCIVFFGVAFLRHELDYQIQKAIYNHMRSHLLTQVRPIHFK